MPQSSSSSAGRSRAGFLGLALAGAIVTTIAGVIAAKMNSEASNDTATAFTIGAFVIAFAFAAVALRLGWNRGIVWLLATVVPAGLYIAADDPADVLAPLATACGIATLLGAALAWLPPRGRRWLASLIIVWHFGAILVLVLSSPNPSWIISQAHDRVYRPYLQFMHLRETYKWFSPEPGSEPLLFFRLQYADDSSKWIVLRRPEDFASSLEYLRFGSLTTWAFSTQPVGEDQLNELLALRMAAGAKHDPVIPLAAVSIEEQYQEPSSLARLILRSYVRRVAMVNGERDAEASESNTTVSNVAADSNTADPRAADSNTAKVNTAARLKSIKVYAALRQAREPQDIIEHLDPLDRSLLSVFYYGEYDPQGELVPECLKYETNADGQVIFKQRDPFLYWLLPAERDDDGNWIDYFEVHAGDAPHWEAAW